jgi:hypothetical protein
MLPTGMLKLSLVVVRPLDAGLLQSFVEPNTTKSSLMKNNVKGAMRPSEHTAAAAAARFPPVTRMGTDQDDDQESHIP